MWKKVHPSFAGVGWCEYFHLNPPFLPVFRFQHLADFGKFSLNNLNWLLNWLFSVNCYFLTKILVKIARKIILSFLKPQNANPSSGCLFINLFQAVNYMYPTIQIIDYILQMLNKMFIGKYAALSECFIVKSKTSFFVLFVFLFCFVNISLRFQQSFYTPPKFHSISDS